MSTRATRKTVRGPYKLRPLAERLWERISPEPNTGCWIWTGTLDSHGYGQFPIYYQHKRAHRLVYEEIGGKQIPSGLVLDHLCKNTWCVNPDHLEPVTQTVNLERVDWPKGNDNHMGARTHCKNGHEFTPQNTGPLSGKSGRLCRECKRQERARRALRNKEALHVNSFD